MSGFQFRLDRVLRLRRQGENETARNLGEARREQEEAGRKLDEAAAILEGCHEHMTTLGEAARALPAGLMRQLRVATHNAAQFVQSAAELHDTTRDRVDEKENEFTEARRERRVLERLRERAGEEWNRDHSRLEQKETDATAQSRWRPREEST